MGIDPSTLKLRIVSTDITMSPVAGRTYEHLTYEVFHDGTGAIVSGNKLAEVVADATRIQVVDSTLYARAVSEYQAALWQYGSNASLSGYSPYDVSLMLEYWSFELEAGGTWKLSRGSASKSFSSRTTTSSRTL